MTAILSLKVCRDYCDPSWFIILEFRVWKWWSTCEASSETAGICCHWVPSISEEFPCAAVANEVCKGSPVSEKKIEITTWGYQPSIHTFVSAKHLISSVDSTRCNLIYRKLAWGLDNTTNVSKAFFWKRIIKGFSKYGTNVMDMWAGQEKTDCNNRLYRQ